MHLPGMVVSLTTLPVIGVPIKSSNSIDGQILSSKYTSNAVRVPVATVVLNGLKMQEFLRLKLSQCITMIYSMLCVPIKSH